MLYAFGTVENLFKIEHRCINVQCDVYFVL
uniref:Uncharacterized protein n=1 Tax=Physcomitrium patens TaxID=3218 RepID=A0A2K1K402_PHYPA|nr:hypothetical protein PHYPA_012993 [Physcomitrium patens]